MNQIKYLVPVLKSLRLPEIGGIEGKAKTEQQKVLYLILQTCQFKIQIQEITKLKIP